MKDESKHSYESSRFARSRKTGALLELKLEEHCELLIQAHALAQKIETAADCKQLLIKIEEIRKSLTQMGTLFKIEEEDDGGCRCRDCGKRFNKGDEGDNETICLRCEANFLAQVNYDNENGYNDRD